MQENNSYYNPYGFQGFQAQPATPNPFSSPSNTIVATIGEDGKIYQVSGAERKEIGVTQKLYSEVIEMANGFRKKLEDNGLIEKEVTQEDILKDIQNTLKSTVARIEKIETKLEEKEECLT